MTDGLDRCLGAMEDAGVDVLFLGQRVERAVRLGCERLWLAGTRPFAPSCVVVRSTRAVHSLSNTDVGFPHGWSRAPALSDELEPGDDHGVGSRDRGSRCRWSHRRRRDDAHVRAADRGGPTERRARRRGSRDPRGSPVEDSRPRSTGSVRRSVSGRGRSVCARRAAPGRPRARARRRVRGGMANLGIVDAGVRGDVLCRRRRLTDPPDHDGPGHGRRRSRGDERRRAPRRVGGLARPDLALWTADHRAGRSLVTMARSVDRPRRARPRPALVSATSVGAKACASSASGSATRGIADDDQLEAGMVVALELTAHGILGQDLVLLTAAGREMLTTCVYPTFSA